MKVYGVGINDANYAVTSSVRGKQVTCPFYQRWCSMLKRCYDLKYHSQRPTYIDCSVVKEWHSFMTFRGWMIEQDWKGKQIDKDVLFPGNKVYGPGTCVFVDQPTNSLLTDHTARRGKWPIGVHKSADRFLAQVRVDGETVYLGCFETPEEAHEKWREAKSAIVWEAAKRQPDSRVKAALETKALKLAAY